MNDKEWSLLESSCLHDAINDTTLLITKDYDYIKSQIRMLSILNQLVRKENTSLNTNATVNNKYTTRILLEAINCIKQVNNSMCEYHKPHPLIELFFQITTNNNLYRTLGKSTPTPVDIITLNNLLHQFQVESNSVKYKRKLRNFHRTSQKNHLSSLSYINELFENYSKILVLRVDLSYLKSKYNSITAATTQIHRKKLLKSVQSHSLFQHCIGYLWKMEFGSIKGFHYHTCFFFDGNKVRNDILLARLVGVYWSQKITDGMGLYFNCNAAYHQDDRSGIGNVHYSDNKKRNNLKIAIKYLTKTDSIIRLTLPNNSRIFGRGEMIKNQSKKRGRPRQSNFG
ncbi:YagK/YfjJ domain-containing protein [Gibbsiella quercinecans]|uniref:YagK/YfjJ domain-containing protein n=1 Tax=Gibbsiella quercinecans TaxID=929813 RepID=UPI003A4E5979